MSSEIHLFVVWPGALHLLERIIADLQLTFQILDVIRLRWQQQTFDRNVLRFYGKPVLDDAAKRVCAGFPVLIVVLDENPVYAKRKRTVGTVLVNARTFDAKQRYRAWAGGGHAVHATIERSEVERDLFFLLGCLPEHYLRHQWDGQIVERTQELTGAEGWDDVGQLYTAISMTMPLVLLEQHATVAYALVASASWALLYANAHQATLRPEGLWCDVRVAGQTQRLVLQEPGDGVLDPTWQQSLLERGRADSSTFLAAPRDQLFTRLHRLLAYEPTHLAQEAAELDRLATATGIPAVDWADTAATQGFLDAELARQGYSFSSGGSRLSYEAGFLPGGQLSTPPTTHHVARGKVVPVIGRWLSILRASSLLANVMRAVAIRRERTRQE